MLFHIRPPPDSTLLHYLKASDLEMEFQLRERNLATLEYMQNNAVDVEANFLMRREKVKNIDLEESTSLEVKLDILVSAIEEIMQNITTRNEYDAQYHGSLIEEEQVVDPKHFLSYPIVIDLIMIVL